METEQYEQKLVAILYADVAGYSRLTGADEAGTHRTLSNYLDLFAETIELHRGNVVHYAGDAILAEFGMVSDALNCAINVQQDLQQRDKELPKERQVRFRIGVNLGEVIVDRDDIYGEGVNVAARLESLAEPGGVCVSEAVRNAVGGKLPLDYEFMGEQEVKNINEPVRAYSASLKPGESLPAPSVGPTARRPMLHVVAATAVAIVLVIGAGFIAWWQPWKSSFKPASVQRMAFPLPDKPSIVVLPFTNMSGDPEQEYFVDGMTEDLITDLSKISGLFVIARNSAFTYKGQNVQVGQVAEELGVRFVLEGSVRRVRDQVRINAQLIDATTGGHMWAERYDGSLTDVFALQDSVTEQIVSALAVNLTDDEAVPRRVRSAEAYDAFLQGWGHYQRHTPDELAKAVPYFEEAIRLDSDYAQAHAALAAVYWEIWSNGWVEKLDTSLPDAMTSAKTHLYEAMKEPTPLAHWVASNILVSQGKYEEAVAEAEAVIALDTNNAPGYAALANALALAGKPSESAESIQKAARLDPYSSPLHHAAEKGDIDEVRRLVAENVHIDVKDHYARTPLHVATQQGHTGIVELLIAEGANVNAKTAYHRSQHLYRSTPLNLVAVKGYTRIAELLIAGGADVSLTEGRYKWTPLHVAANHGHTGVAEVLIDSGADLEAKNIAGWTPLHQAVLEDHESVAELLIDKGADINVQDKDGSTLLHVAAFNGNAELAELLIVRGANINAKRATPLPGETPLHAAAFAGREAVAELLMAKGANVNAKTQYGHTPLHRAVREGHRQMVELLINKGADVNTKDSGGGTPLHVAATRDDITMVELLIAEGADIDAKDNNGYTPLDHALGGEPTIVNSLKRHGALCTAC